MPFHNSSLFKFLYSSLVNPFINIYISNPTYTGEIQMYPKEFLEAYFREPDSIHMEDLPGQINYDIDDDLPF